MCFSRLAAFFLVAVAFVLAATSPVLAQYQGNEENDGGDASVARLQVRISELEEQIRRMQGTVEQVSFENKQLKTQLEKMNSDVDFRMGELEKKQAGSASAVAEPQNDSGKLRPVDAEGDSKPDARKVLAENAAAAALPKFSSSREHYNYAFKLLNQAKYPESGAAFAAFTQSYPKDPLIGNAYYWLGETYYVRRDYVRAADDFRQGYEAMPAGPKAPDNLLKLAMSLNALKKDKEACVILKQVVVKFGNSSGSMKLRAEQEMNAIGCNN